MLKLTIKFAIHSSFENEALREIHTFSKAPETLTRESAEACGIIVSGTYSPEGWTIFQELIRSASPEHSITMLKHASSTSMTRPLLSTCWTFLNDQRSHVSTSETQVKVRSCAAEIIAEQLDLPWIPNETWKETDWEQLRKRADSAILRLDKKMIHGILQKSDE